MKEEFPNQFFFNFLEKADKIVLLKLHNCAVMRIVLFSLQVAG